MMGGTDFKIKFFRKLLIEWKRGSVEGFSVALKRGLSSHRT